MLSTIDNESGFLFSFYQHDAVQSDHEDTHARYGVHLYLFVPLAKDVGTHEVS